jgi:hypothetical protein
MAFGAAAMCTFSRTSKPEAPVAVTLAIAIGTINAKANAHPHILMVAIRSSD